MDKWKSIEIYLASEYEKAKKDTGSVTTINKSIDTDIIIRKKLKTQLNSTPYYFEKAKNLLSDELFEHMIHYNLNLNFLDITLIIYTENLVNYFHSHDIRFSDDRNEFEKDIKQFKKKAKQQKSFHNQIIRFTLPFLPKVSLSLLDYYLVYSKMDNESIDDIFRFFTKHKKARVDHKHSKFLTKICDKILKNESKNMVIDIVDIRNKITKKIKHLLYFKIKGTYREDKFDSLL